MNDYQNGVFDGRQTIINQIRNYHSDNVFNTVLNGFDIQLSLEEYAVNEFNKFSEFINKLENEYLYYEEDEIAEI